MEVFFFNLKYVNLTHIIISLKERRKCQHVLPHWFNFDVGKGVEDTFCCEKPETENLPQTSLNNKGYLLAHVK